ncbi:MAG: thioredoxin domain-containing protein [Polyangiaceae bacterium]
MRPHAPASRSLFVVGCALALLSGMGFFRGASHFAPLDDREALIENPPTWSDAEASVPVDSNDPIWGSRFALVTVVVFSDFECPHCREFEHTLDEVKRTFDPRDLRVVWKHSPLGRHANARAAAIAGNTVFRLGGSRAFFRWAERAFDHQGSLTVDDFADWASEVGVDEARFRAAFASNEFAAKVDEDLELGARLGLAGAPMSLVNGLTVRGAASFEKMRRIIDDEMEAARELRATVPQDAIYVEATRKNRPPLEPAPAPAPPTPPGPSLDKTVYRVPLSSDDVFRGPDQAPVTLIEIGDFSAATRGAYATVESVLAKYEGRVRFAFRPRVLPSDRDGFRAANILLDSRRASGDAGYWAAFKRLFEPALPPDESVVLGDLHLDAKALETALKSNTYGPVLARFASATADLELPGVPAFFVNGRRFTGPPSEAELSALVDEELAHAEALTQAGTAPADVYGSIVAAATDLPAPEKRIIAAPAKAPSRGDARAPVVVQVFGDLESPYSKRARGSILDLERMYGATIRVVWRHRPLPVDKNAILAAEAALEAYAQKGDAGFWAYVDAVFDAQGRGADVLSRPSLVALAKKLDFDAKAFDAALGSHVHRADVEADARASDEASVGGVPAFSINGYFLAGNVPLARLVRAVDLALRDAAR